MEAKYSSLISKLSSLLTLSNRDTYPLCANVWRPNVNGWQLVTTTGLREVARTWATIAREEIFAQSERNVGSVIAGAIDLYVAGRGPVTVFVNSDELFV